MNLSNLAPSYADVIDVLGRGQFQLTRLVSLNQDNAAKPALLQIHNLIERLEYMKKIQGSKYVVMNASAEQPIDGTIPYFWNPDIGWGEYKDATEFSLDEKSLFAWPDWIKSGIWLIPINKDPPHQRYTQSVLLKYNLRPEMVLYSYLNCYERIDDETDLQFIARVSELDYLDGDDAACFQELHRAIDDTDQE